MTIRMLNFIKNTLQIHPYFFPVLGFVPTFVILGAYGGFVETKHKPLFHNVLNTAVGSLCGCLCGGLLGVAWPITFPVLAARVLMSVSKPK